MANTENKNQHTLYRFVSLRNPELTKKENQSKRFVFHPDNITGEFFREMTTRTTSQTKWEKLLSTSITFASSSLFIKTLEKLELIINKDFFQFANWLASNRTKLNSPEVLDSINTLNLKVIDLKIELNLWDNLFYQVVTQNDFYIKENIIHILVLNNLLKEINLLSKDTEKIDFISTLAQARVVLPTILFEEDKTIVSSTSTASAKKALEVEPNLEEIQETNRSTANLNITSLETAQTEITLLEKKYFKEYNKAYQKAISDYEKLTKPLLDKYQNDWDEAKRKLCDVPKPENYDPNDFCNLPNVKYPSLPEFEFEFSPKVDNETLKNDLSNESYLTLEQINALKDNETYAEISEKIKDAITIEQKRVIENTNFSTPVLLIGGVTISTKSKNSTLSKGKEEKINPAFVPERFGVRNIGIADYKKVVSHVCCYDAGEVSHIENIMAKELRSKTTTKEHIEEFTDTTETQQEKESLTDTTSTDRFEMQTEISKLLMEQKQFGASANFQAGWGSKTGTGEYLLDVGANYATNSSKEESNRQAVTQAKDITNRAMERIVTKMRHETIKKVTDRFKEENIHAFDNTKGENHVSGVYRFINSIYKNQVFNYGKRMMYEFMIPQPSKLHKLGMIENTNGLNTMKLENPTNPKDLNINSFTDINENNYQAIASKYGAEVNEFPEKTVTVGKSIANSSATFTTKNETFDLKIPENYEAIHSKIKLYTYYNNTASIYINFALTVGNIVIKNPSPIINPSNQNGLIIEINTETNPAYVLDKYKETVPISYQAINYLGYNIVVNIKCQLTQEAKEKWQKDTFNTIIKAYEAKMQEYLSSLESNQSSRESNPGFYRDIEQLVLRKNCISYLMDEAKMGQGYYSFYPPTPPSTTIVKNLANFHIDQTQEMDSYSSMVKFMEQAFEWDIISYYFYPFYWGNRNDWSELYQYECNDPLFRNFMQSGMARVVVTVKPGFENAVLHFMATGQIWNGGEIPVLGNPLYLSIVDEIKEQEYTIEDTWETVVPTSLVALQSSGVVIDAAGLPCGTDCQDHAGENFKINDATLGLKVVETVLPTK